MINCPNCGAQNDNAARFCGECGADLRSLRATAPEPLTPPVATAPAFGSAQSQAQGGNWQTSNGFPEPPKKGRRVWLWVVIGTLALCLACCCGFAIWAGGPGEETFGGWMTQLSDELTEVAPTQTPRR